MADELAQIISRIRASHQRTNLRSIDACLPAESLKPRPEKMLAYLLQYSGNLSDKDYVFNFDPVENLFLNKLVSQQIFDKRVNLEKNDYFKGIVFLDFLAGIVLGDYKIVDEIYQLAKDLERIDQHLDPSLEIVAKYAGMNYLQQFKKEMLIQKIVNREERISNESARRYARLRKSTFIDMPSSQFIALEPISEAYQDLGAKVYGMINNEALRQKISNSKSICEVKAAIFIDSVLDVLQEETARQDVERAVMHNEYYKASMIAISALSKEAAGIILDSYAARASRRTT